MHLCRSYEAFLTSRNQIQMDVWTVNTFSKLKSRANSGTSKKWGEWSRHVFFLVMYGCFLWSLFFSFFFSWLSCLHFYVAAGSRIRYQVWTLRKTWPMTWTRLSFLVVWFLCNFSIYSNLLFLVAFLWLLFNKHELYIVFHAGIGYASPTYELSLGFRCKLCNLFFSVERYGSLYIQLICFSLSHDVSQTPCLLSWSNLFCELVAHLVYLVYIHSYCYSWGLFVDFFSFELWENDRFHGSQIDDIWFDWGNKLCNKSSHRWALLYRRYCLVVQDSTYFWFYA